jgi:hypothetical protein
VLNHSRIALLILTLTVAAGCSRSENSGSETTEGQAAQGDDAALSAVRAAARALAEPEPSVNYVAAQMKGVIKARTKSQALMHYEGYRVTLTTPGDRVTRIVFDLVEAKPTMGQLTELFGKPEEVGRGMLYRVYTEATGSTIRVLAEPTSKPATEASLVRRILIEGEKIR